MIRATAAALAGSWLLLAAPAAQAACHLAVAEQPVTMVGLRATAPVRVNGVDALFEVDSGSFYNAITPSAARRSDAETVLAAPDDPFQGDREVEVTGFGGATVLDVVRVGALALSGYKLQDARLVVVDEGGFDGLLGQDALSSDGDVEYDFADGDLRLVRSSGCGGYNLAYWAGNRPYSVVDITTLGNERFNSAATPTIATVYVNGVPVRALFDTGSTSMLSRSAAARAGVRPTDSGVTPGGVNAGVGPRLYNTWIAPFASVKIGDEEIRNTHLRISDADMLDEDMIIGVEFFLSHRIFVSNAQRKMFFTYNGGPVFDLSVGPPPPAAATASPPDGVVPSADPKDADGFARRAAASVARDDITRALDDLTRAIQMAPSQAQYRIQRGATYARARRYDLALADFDEALKLKPDDPAALLGRGKLRATTGDASGAAADVDAAARRVAQNDPDEQLGLAEVYVDVGAFDPAIAQFDRWIAANHGDARLAGVLAWRCRARALAGRDLDKAVADCDRAAHMAPKMAAARDSHGLVHLRRGEYDLALADFDAALALQPDDAWALYGRALVENRQGRFADAMPDGDAAAALDPDLPGEAKLYGLTDGAPAQAAPSAPPGPQTAPAPARPPPAA